MKTTLYVILFFGLFSSLYAQDTTFQSSMGTIKLERKGFGNDYKISGHYQKNYAYPYQSTWVEGKVEKVDYEYNHVRTYYGSTQPANPEEFYKPIKMKSHYYKPIGDITIWYRDSNKIHQIFRADSNILRTYFENGKPKSIHYFNASLELDSIYQFYSNGKIKTKQIGNWRPVKNNLHFGFTSDPVMYMVAQINPKQEWEFHGNGKPYIQVEFTPESDPQKSQDATDVLKRTYQLTNFHTGYRNDNKYHYKIQGFKNKVTLFDTSGKLTSDLYYTSDHTWTGIKYEYYENGNIESIKNVLRNQSNGVYEFRNQKGELTHRQYYRKWHYDSTVYYRRIQDTLFTWKDPWFLNWDTNTDKLTYVKNDKAVSFQFDEKGEIIEYSFEGNRYWMYNENLSEKPVTQHLGNKDKYGLPHGKWVGINDKKDTIYEIHFFHGKLHGPFHVDFKKNHQNWTRNYHMGLECDSSYQYFDQKKTKITYYSSPGKISKKVENFTDGKLNRVDTSLNGTTLIRLLIQGHDGRIIEKATFDTTNKQIITKRYTQQGFLESERITEYYGIEKETKSFYPESNTVKVHLIYTGYATVPENIRKETYDERGEPMETILRERSVRMAIRKTYNEQGALIEEVKLQDGVVVK